MARIFPLFCLVAFLALTACAPRAEIRRAEPIGAVAAPSFELVPGRTSIERSDPPGAGGQLEMTVGAMARNTNDFGMRLDEVDYTVYLEDKQVARGVITPEAYLEPGATAPVSFDLSSSVSRDGELLRAAVRAFADRPMQFRIEGTLRFSTATHNYETRSRVLLRGATLARQTVKAPILRLDETASRVFMLSPGVPVVQLVMQVANPGDIGYFLYGKDLELSLANWPLAQEDMSPVPLAAGQATRIDILFYPLASELGDEARFALDAAVSGGTTLLRLEGDLFMDVLGVDSFAVPSGWSVIGFVRNR